MSITRVHFRERQPLRATDLEVELAYHIAMRRRHNASSHGWGLVTGLTLEPSGGGLLLRPGMAVDGYGRELIVPAAWLLTVDILQEYREKLGNREIDLWLVYARVPVDPPQRGRWECGPGQHRRWREESWLRLTRAGALDPYRPVVLPPEYQEADPRLASPDDPGQEWPVYLGRIQMNASGPLEISMAGRPSVTLAGETVTAPSGSARMQVGGERVEDRRRFLVILKDASGALKDRLTVDDAGNTRLWGNAALQELPHDVKDTEHAHDGDARAGHLRIAATEESPRGRAPGEPPPIPALIFATPAPLPKAAAPWQMYRTLVPQSEAEDAPKIDQLRLEIGHPGGDPARYQVAIGRAGNPRSFTPHLTVGADGTVRVHGEQSRLRVEGQVTEGPIRVDADDPRFNAALLGSWLGGITAAGNALQAFYTESLQITIASPTALQPGDLWQYSIVVSNLGREPLNGIRLAHSIIRGDAVIGAEAPQEEFALPAGEAHAITRERHVAEHAGTGLILAALALGIGREGATVFGSALTRVTIQTKTEPNKPVIS